MYFACKHVTACMAEVQKFWVHPKNSFLLNVVLLTVSQPTCKSEFSFIECNISNNALYTKNIKPIWGDGYEELEYSVYCGGKF